MSTIPFRDQSTDDRLKRILTSDSGLFSDLSPDDLIYLKTFPVMVQCPTCGKAFDPVDFEHRRIRRYCSLDCSNKARGHGKWACVLCRSRFKHHKALQQHLRKAHPEIDDHEYLHRYYQDTGKNPENLQRFCPSCMRARKLNFGRARYDECACIRADRKLVALVQEAKSLQGPDLSRANRSIGGLRSLLKRLRRHPPTVHVFALAPVKRRTAAIECSWMDGLIDQAKRVEDLQRAHYGVYEAYYDHLSLVSSVAKGTFNGYVLSRLEELEPMALSHGWQVGDHPPDGTWLFIRVRMIEATGADSKPQWKHLHLKSPVTLEEYRRLRDALRFDGPAVHAYLKQYADMWPFSYTNQPNYDCWQRHMVSECGSISTRFHAAAILKIKEAMDSLPLGEPVAVQ